METIETEKEILDRLPGKPFFGMESYHKAVKQFFVSQGYKVEKARYDEVGNCLTCGEAGRCHGWHFQRGF